MHLTNIIRQWSVPKSKITGGWKRGIKAIRLVRYGCTNRPFYHIVVMLKRKNQHLPPIEQLGSFDPLPNVHNERLVAINFERVRYWMGRRTVLSQPVAELFGLAGFLPIHPQTYMTAWRNRRKSTEAEAERTEGAEGVSTS